MREAARQRDNRPSGFGAVSEGFEVECLRRKAFRTPNAETKTSQLTELSNLQINKHTQRRYTIRTTMVPRTLAPAASP